MKIRLSLSIVGLMAALASACSSGDDSPQCEFHTQAALSTSSSWPKFRHDLQNTGTLSGVDLTDGTLQPAWVFSPINESPAAFAASPVLNSADSLIYIGSTNGSLYAVDADDGSLSSILLSTGAPISSTVLIAVRGEEDALFMGGGTGLIYNLDPNGIPEPQFWPYPANAAITGGPSLSNIDGTVYAGTPSGFFAICPNGITRFGYVYQGLQSPQAVGPDGTVYFGSNDAQLRAIFPTGKFNWAFSATAPILAAPVINATENSTYMADTNGFVFKVTSAGTPDPGFIVADVGPVRASPALAGNALYVPSTDGNLYALNAASGAVMWSYPTGKQIMSSPAVAVNAADQAVVVFGSDDGNLYIIEDMGTEARTVQVCQLGANFACTAEPPSTGSGPAIRSSPAIRADDGTIYVGADDGSVYAIRPGSATAGTP